MISGALGHEDPELIQRIRDAVRNAEIETGDDNDPHSEHDFGSVEVAGVISGRLIITTMRWMRDQKMHLIKARQSVC